MNGHKLDIVEEAKYLGITLDYKLRLDRNSDNLCKKLGQKVNVISRLRKELTAGQKAMLYKTIIEPHFTYCASVLFLATKTEIDRMQSIQNKCMRNILGVNRFTSSDYLLDTLKLMSVQQIITFRTMIFIYKIIHGQAPKYLTDKIKMKNENHDRLLRNHGQIELSNSSKACSQNSLFYRGIQTYNEIPDHIKNETSKQRFETKLRDYIKQKF